MQGTVLIVDPDSAHALVLRDALVSDGNVVRIASSFQAAVETLAAGGVGVLITAVRLGAFNGLHLIIRSKALYPHIRSIVIGLPADRCCESDRLHAPFLQKPVAASTIVTAVAGEIERAASSPQRRWPRKHVHLPAVVSNADLDIVDLSYGGLRLQGAKTPVGVGSELTIKVPSLGVSIKAIARWTKPMHEEGVSWCGAEIVDPGTINDWTGVVDSLN